MKLKSTKLLNIISIIVLLHLLSRILIYFLYLSEREIFFSNEFNEALSNENFFSYFLFHHSTPIGNILLSKVALIIFGKNNLYFFYFFINSIYSLTVLLVLTKIYKFVFKEYSNFLYFILLLTSISFMSYDSWRVNHYDHSLVFLFSILSLFFSKIFLSNKKILFNYKYISLMTLMILFSNLFIIIFLTFVFFLIVLRKKYNINFKSFVYSSLIIVVFFFSTLVKNKISIDEYTPTSIKGWNFIQRPLYTLGYDSYFDLYLEKLNLSKINKICVNEIKKNKSENTINKDDLFLSLVLHKCFFNEEKQIYNYVLLKKILKNNKIFDPKLNRAIRLDIKDLKNNKWMFSGGHEDINLRTTVFFHKESLKLYLSAFIHYPYKMLIGSISTKDNQGIIFTFLNMFRWGGQLPYYYEPQHKDFNNDFIKTLQILFSILILFGLSLSILRSYYLLVSFVFKKEIKNLDVFICLLLFLCIGFNLTTSFITCCENQRNTVMIFPLLITISTLSISAFIKNAKVKKNYYRN